MPPLGNEGLVDLFLVLDGPRALGSSWEAQVGPEGPSAAPPLLWIAVGGMGRGGRCLGQKGDEEWLGTRRKSQQLLWAVWPGTFRGC